MANSTKTATPTTQESKAEAAANGKPIAWAGSKQQSGKMTTDNGIRYVRPSIQDDWKQTESFCRDDQLWLKSPIRLTLSSSKSSKTPSKAFVGRPGFGRAAI